MISSFYEIWLLVNPMFFHLNFTSRWYVFCRCFKICFALCLTLLSFALYHTLQCTYLPSASPYLSALFLPSTGSRKKVRAENSLNCRKSRKRGVAKWPPLKKYLNVFRFKRNLVWLFLIAICTNMQKIRPISQKFTEILRF